MHQVMDSCALHAQTFRIALLPLLPEFFIHPIDINLEMRRHNQQVVELYGSHPADGCARRNQFSTAYFPVLEPPIHLVMDADACRPANVLGKGCLPLCSDFCRPVAPSRRRVGGPGLQRWFMEAPRLTKCRCSVRRPTSLGQYRRATRCGRFFAGGNAAPTLRRLGRSRRQ